MLKFKYIFAFLFILLFSSLSHAYQQFEFVREIGEAGKKASQRLLNEPRALALAGDRIYIADTDAHRVVVLDQSGTVILSWGKKGDQPGEFKSPSGIAGSFGGVEHPGERNGTSGYSSGCSSAGRSPDRAHPRRHR